MSPRSKAKAAKANAQLPTIHPHAAGIDIGATALQVAVPCDADARPVRTFSTFTDDLLRLRDWLIRCRVRTVAMESTSVYWIPLFQILEAAGLEVCLVNARHAKNLPGRKTDVNDCQWLQYLHSVGLLRASFRPPEHICAVRALLRHRSNLNRYAGQQVQHLHKALTQMNVQIHNVLSDIVGMTGLLILDAIVAGERDPQQLARFKNGRVKATRDTIARSLTGNWQSEHLFTLKQALTTWRHYQHQMVECEAEIQRVLSSLDTGTQKKPLPAPRASLHERHSNFDVRTELYCVLGVDLTQVPAIQQGIVLLLFTELGPDFVSKFPTAKCFASWLGLCPDNRITGGKIISVKTRDVKNRAAMALRLAAQSLWRSKDYLGECFRRWKARLGTPKAITAMAHKLARIIWHLIKYKEAYDPKVWAAAEEKMKAKRLKRLEQSAASFGFKLVCNTTA
jgi:transposase